MAIARTAVQVGPAQVDFDGATLYFQNGLTLAVETEFFRPPSDLRGPLDRRKTNTIIRVRGTPVGEWNATIRDALWPWAKQTPFNAGIRMLGATDTPLVITDTEGEETTLLNTTVTRQPNIRVGSQQTLIGEVEFTACIGLGLAPEDANSMVAAVATGTFGSGPAASQIITKPPAMAFGLTPWDSFETVDGVEVEFPITFEPLTIDSVGIFDYLLMARDAIATFRPIGAGIDQEAIRAKSKVQGTGAGVGESLLGGAASLEITADGVYVELPQAGILDSEGIYNSNEIRNNPIRVAARSDTGGALAVITDVAPV